MITREKFSKLSKKDKKTFLAMDMIERLIRVEQTVSNHFNKQLCYKDTLYFKGLCAKEKEEYEGYLKNKRKNKFLVLSSLILIPVLLAGLINFNLTGNVIQEDLGVSLLDIIIGVSSLIVILIIIIYLRKGVRDRRFEKKADHIYKIYRRK